MKFITLILCLPFFLLASVLVIVAGLFGGNHWHVIIELRPNTGEPLGDIKIS